MREKGGDGEKNPLFRTLYLPGGKEVTATEKGAIVDRGEREMGRRIPCFLNPSSFRWSRSGNNGGERAIIDVRGIDRDRERITGEVNDRRR